MPSFGELALVGFIAVFVLVGIRLGAIGDALGALGARLFRGRARADEQPVDEVVKPRGVEQRE